MYSPESLHHLPGVALYEIVAELHASLIGLLWQIDDVKNFDDSLWESHFDDTVPVERAEQIHRLLLARRPKDIIEKELLADRRDEFASFWDRCRVDDSMPPLVRGTLPLRTQTESPKCLSKPSPSP